MESHRKKQGGEDSEEEEEFEDEEEEHDETRLQGGGLFTSQNFASDNRFEDVNFGNQQFHGQNNSKPDEEKNQRDSVWTSVDREAEISKLTITLANINKECLSKERELTELCATIEKKRETLLEMEQTEKRLSQFLYAKRAEVQDLELMEKQLHDIIVKTTSHPVLTNPIPTNLTDSNPTLLLLLRERESEINNKTKELDELRNFLNKRETELLGKEESLNDREASLLQRERIVEIIHDIEKVRELEEDRDKYKLLYLEKCQELEANQSQLDAKQAEMDAVRAEMVELSSLEERQKELQKIRDDADNLKKEIVVLNKIIKNKELHQSNMEKREKKFNLIIEKKRNESVRT